MARHKQLDILTELKDIRFKLDQVCSDDFSNLQGAFLNQAKNKLASLIADGERVLKEKMARSLYPQTGYVGDSDHEKDDRIL